MEVRILFVLSVLAVILTGTILLGLWTYKDAKARGLNGGLWVAVVLLTPNFIGLLLYFLIGRRNNAICSSCNKMIQTGSMYCPHCGQQQNQEPKIIGQRKSSNKGLLIGFIICIVTLTLLFAGAIFYSIYSEGFAFNNSIAIGMINNSFGDKWNVSFRSFSGTLNSSVSIKDGNPKALEIETSLEEGNLILHIYQGNTNLSIPIKIGDDNFQQDLSQFKEGRVNLKLEGSKAKRGKIRIRW